MLKNGLLLLLSLVAVQGQTQIDWNTQIKNKPSSFPPNLPIDWNTGISNRPTIPSALTLPIYVSSVYNFTPVAPGGSISIGSNQISFTACPLGVSGGSVNYSGYLSNGTGTAEAVLITGGTCTGDGTTAGTIFVTAANTHSGAWTFGSATGGTQEAICALPAAGGSVLDNSNVTIHTNITNCGKTQVLVSKTAGISLGTSFTVLGQLSTGSPGFEYFSNAVGAHTLPKNSFLDAGPIDWNTSGPPNYVGYYFQVGASSPAFVNGSSAAHAVLGSIAGPSTATGTRFFAGVAGNASTASHNQAVGLYGQAFPAIGAQTDAFVFGANLVALNNGIQVSGVIGSEIDLLSGIIAPDNIVGEQIFSDVDLGIIPSGEFSALLVDVVPGRQPFNYGIHLRTGISSTSTAILIEPTGTGTSSYSQAIDLRAISPGGTQVQGNIYTTPYGTITVDKPISGVTCASPCVAGLTAIDASLFNMYKILLTANAAPTMTGPPIAAATTIQLVICEDGTGGRTWTWPASVKGGMVVTTTANKCSSQAFTWDGTNFWPTGTGVLNL